MDRSNSPKKVVTNLREDLRLDQRIQPHIEGESGHRRTTQMPAEERLSRILTKLLALEKSRA
jgi:hypothetical protein